MSHTYLEMELEQNFVNSDVAGARKQTEHKLSVLISSHPFDEWPYRLQCFTFNNKSRSLKTHILLDEGFKWLSFPLLVWTPLDRIATKP